MANQLSLAGAQETKPVHFAPIFTNRFFQGIWTQRNPLRDAGSTRIEEKFYGTRGDAMIAGANVEISNRLTPVRRPGSSVYNSQTFTDVNYFYEFRLFDTNTEEIKVMVDTASTLYDGTGPDTKTLVWTKSAGAGQTYMQYVANTLFFGNGVDQKKWLQTLLTWTPNTQYDINDLQTFVIDPNGNVEQLIGTSITKIINVEVQSNVLTLEVGTTDGLTVGDTYVLWGLTTATFLNGYSITPTELTAGDLVIAPFTHPDYTTTNDTGAVMQQVGGTPESGATEPTWNTDSTQPNNTTIDGTAIWANRGSTIENWGIVGPTSTAGGTVTVNRGVGVIGWQAHTFYSNTQVSVDTQFSGQTNIWQVSTKGTSGTSNPFTTNPTAGTTTVTDGTVQWECIASTFSGNSAWSAGAAFTPGDVIVANAAGTNCVFEVAPQSYPTYAMVGGDYVTANFYPHASHFSGQCELRNPIDGTNNPGAGSYPLVGSGVGNSVLFNPNQLGGSGSATPLQWGQITQAGDITGYFAPYTGATPGNYTMVVFGNFDIPKPGQYNFTIFHDDGMFWGVGASSGSQAQAISGPNNCPAPQATLTALQGYQVMGANNVNGVYQDNYVVNFPVAGTYPFEIDFAKSDNSGQFCCLYCNGQTPVPGSAETGTTQPVWPSFSLTFAPAYPTAQESNGSSMGGLDGELWPQASTGPGPIKWQNVGPITDYAWQSGIQYQTTSSTTIIDPNNNIQDPYEAGVTGTTEPIFATGINQLTKDNPNLTWINQGPASAPGPGTLSTFDGGWSYTIALVNSLTNTVSNAGPVSTFTGNFIGSPGITISGGLPADIDPQVDYVAIFRTTDGGATYFLIPGTGNTFYTTTLSQYQANGYVDTNPDANLNILLEAPLAAQNTPPPTGLINLTYHLGRIFGSVGNTVYWSSGPDSPIGNGNEGFPPLNSAVYPSLVKRIVPTSIGALVFTVSDMYLLSGQATASSPLFSQPYATGIGLLSYNALAINGTTIYMFTADSQVISLDPSSGLSQIGFPIGDQFEQSNWNASNAYVTWHVSGSQDQALYIADGSTGWFRMTPTAAPESGLTWSPFATIGGGVLAVQSVEVTPGVHRLLLGPVTSGPILMRDVTTWADNGNPYEATFTIGSIVLAQPGQVAELAFITTDASAIGSKPMLAVLIDEVNGNAEALPNFTNDPPQLVSPSSLYSQRFYFSQTQSPALCRHLQMKVTWPAENYQNELLSMTIFGAYMQED
jgi:hypothetical protein